MRTSDRRSTSKLTSICTVKQMVAKVMQDLAINTRESNLTSPVAVVSSALGGREAAEMWR